LYKVVQVSTSYKLAVVYCLSCQFGGESGGQFVTACADFCRDQTHAHDVLRFRRQKDAKLALFLQVTDTADV